VNGTATSAEAPHRPSPATRALRSAARRGRGQSPNLGGWIKPATCRPPDATSRHWPAAVPLPAVAQGTPAAVERLHRRSFLAAEGWFRAITLLQGPGFSLIVGRGQPALEGFRPPRARNLHGQPQGRAGASKTPVAPRASPAVIHVQTKGPKGGNWSVGGRADRGLRR